jgi:hypothetical protein
VAGWTIVVNGEGAVVIGWGMVVGSLVGLFEGHWYSRLESGVRLVDSGRLGAAVVGWKHGGT